MGERMTAKQQREYLHEVQAAWEKLHPGEVDEYPCRLDSDLARQFRRNHVQQLSAIDEDTVAREVCGFDVSDIQAVCCYLQMSTTEMELIQSRVGGSTYAEIAELHEVSANTARAWVRSALSRLRLRGSWWLLVEVVSSECRVPRSEVIRILKG